MSLQIAETKFITKASSGLAAVDVYGTSPEKQAKNAGSVLSGLAAGFKTPNTAGEVNKIVDGLTKALEKTKGKSYTEQMAALKGVLGGKDALLKNFKNSLVTDVLTNVGFGKNAKEIAGVLVGDRDPSNLLTALGKTNPEMKIVVNGIQTVMGAKDLDTAVGIADLLGKLTGNTELVKVFDLQPETLLLKSLLDSATMFRVPSLIDTILDSASSDKERKVLLVASVPKTAENSDLETILKTMKEIGDTNTYRTHPTLVVDLLANYIPVSGMSPTKEEGSQLREILDRLKPEWWLVERNGEKVYNLDAFYNLSQSAKEALYQFNDLSVPLTLTGVYRPKEFDTLRTEARPWALV